MDYKNKNILAPMVRCSTLAFRLMALEYGADLVYSEEIIDYKLVNAKRHYNELFNTIDYIVDGTEKPVFQTCHKEKDKVIFQVGTNNATRALQACKLVENDVAGFDVNMGCPKEFSVQGGMGAALLKKPDDVKQILTTLVNGLSKPVTCKIRCLHSLEETINLCKLIESCGVRALAIHGRFQEERSRMPNHDDYIREIVKHIQIPIIANGGSNEIKCYEDIEKFRQSCNASSVMIARAGMWNCSVFRREGVLPIDDVVKRFLEISLEVDNYFFSVKYAVQQMLHEELASERGAAVLGSLAGEELYKIFHMLNEYNELQKKKEEYYRSSALKRKIDEEESAEIKKAKESGTNLICRHAKYSKKDFREGTHTPKSILNAYVIHHGLPKPIYRTEEKLPEKVFKSVLEFNNGFYTTPYWESNKKYTEQAAAMVCLDSIGVSYKIDFISKK
ncbi:tRNA-dihydrouridine(20) synthase [NAD(P)+]-like [Brachionus plicatilis]|uniref:tRNA-dihydrouridine(20) synthase [NAD(P)+]-like n=1 Tax=Brachionus plicatilis TaxID=10195 RepID=A0A3M7R9U5_BRAPC|nr:tRNA-dihydrouridine(20) synthase [NAD(P)+]-like [Brachionus plicatilis]